jgi:hypothetical protein
MANDKNTFKNELKASLQKNFDTATIKEIGDAFVENFPMQWKEFLQTGAADTPANRANFAFNIWYDSAFNLLNSIVKKYRTDNAIKSINVPEL